MADFEDPSIDEEFDDKDEKDVDKDVDEGSRSAREMINPSERTKILAAEAEVTKYGAQLDGDLMTELSDDEAEANYDDSDPADKNDPTAKDGKRDVEKLKDETSKQKRENRAKVRRIVMGVLLGVSLLGGGIAFLIRYLKEKNPKPTDDFPQSALDAAKKLVEQFRAQPEAGFWKGIADWVDTSAPSRQTQAMMMAYAKRLAGDTAKVEWKGVEKGDAIKTLLAARDKADKDSELYRTVATLQHGGVDLQRGARADLCELAVAMLHARQS